MKFGESLKKERELRGMTLAEISQYTKIHSRFLEALENDDLSILPAKAFAKGFLRSYARMVGLDEDEVITNFEYRHRNLQTKEEAKNPKTHPTSGSKHRVLFLTLLLIIVILIAIITLYYQGKLPLNWL